MCKYCLFEGERKHTSTFSIVFVAEKVCTLTNTCGFGMVDGPADVARYTFCSTGHRAGSAGLRNAMWACTLITFKWHKHTFIFKETGKT